MKKVLLRAAGLAMIAVMFGISMSPVRATTISDLEKELEENRKNLDAVAGSITSLENEAELLEEEITDLDAELVNMMTSIGILDDNIAAKETEIADAQIQYEEAKAVEEAQYEAMKLRIQCMYESGEDTLLTILLQADSMADALNKAEYAEQVYAYDRQKLAEYEETTAKVEELRVSLESQKAELQTEKTEMEEQQVYLDSLLTRKKAQSKDYEVQIAKARQEAATYKAKIKEEEKKIAKMQEEERRKLAAATASKTTPNKPAATIITDATGSELGKQIANYACQYIGNPYVLGGTSLTQGADCSGFTYRVYMDFGYSIPRTSYSQRNAGTGVDVSNAQPGDIVCYEGHVGIYIGGGSIVHASTPSSGIKVSGMNYRPIISIRRII